jgi:hypothetical protein
MATRARRSSGRRPSTHRGSTTRPRVQRRHLPGRRVTRRGVALRRSPRALLRPARAAAFPAELLHPEHLPRHAGSPEPPTPASARVRDLFLRSTCHRRKGAEGSTSPVRTPRPFTGSSSPRSSRFARTPSAGCSSLIAASERKPLKQKRVVLPPTMAKSAGAQAPADFAQFFQTRHSP